MERGGTRADFSKAMSRRVETTSKFTRPLCKKFTISPPNVNQKFTKIRGKLCKTVDNSVDIVDKRQKIIRNSCEEIVKKDIKSLFCKYF